jgi:hypothetical protein
VAVGAHRPRPVFFREERCVDIHAESQVVGDEVLAGGSDVHGIEVGEFAPKSLSLFLSDRSILGERQVAEDVVPDLVGHLLRFYPKRANLASVDRRT